jgi:hypothetical protein
VVWGVRAAGGVGHSTEVAGLADGVLSGRTRIVVVGFGCCWVLCVLCLHQSNITNLQVPESPLGLTTPNTEVRNSPS